MKSLCSGAGWTLDKHNSMKMCESPKNFLPGLWILSNPNIMSFPGLQTAHKYKNLQLKMNLGKDI